MTVYYIALGLFALIGIACVLSYAAVATLVYIERRNARHDAEDAEVFGPRVAYPLPAVDDWNRDVIGLQRFEHPTMTRIRERIVGNEVARIDREWAAMNGEGA